MSKGPSKHLSWEELACKDGTPYPREWRDNRAKVLGEVFEIIRNSWGKPIIVLSGYRTKEHNRAIGGAQHSQHMQGRALDLRPPKGISVDEFHGEIKYLSRYVSAIKGIGKYKTFVHVDIRPTERLITWNGKGMKDDTTKNA